MSTPLLHLIAGPNGSGKTTLVERVLVPATHLPFVNADVIAAERWPDRAEAEARALDAAREAETQRLAKLAARESFIAETVFSHPSKLELITLAQARGYLVHLHVVMVPADLTVKRVADRVRRGGHTVPEHKIRERYERLWPLVAQAIQGADTANVYDNSLAATPLRRVATFGHGLLVAADEPPAWAPQVLGDLWS